MLHRPADSRLLSNLLSHEKDYVKSLQSQLEYGQASLASFSAYAAASPPPASHAIAAVAGALVGANDTLRGYAFAVEEWCEQLRMLKEMEDEVGNIARDREILVDRLIKASKSSTPKRRSIITSGASNSPTNTIFASSSSTPLEQLSFSNSKLNLAQNELQACETHLSEKEGQLQRMRENAILKGLKGRCKALVECGKRWEEMGKESLRTLENLNFGQGLAQSDATVLKSLPIIHSPYSPHSSELSSSLAPSQSASQIINPDSSLLGHSRTPSPSKLPLGGSRPEIDIRDETTQYVLSIPPAHAISEEDHYIPPRMDRRVVSNIREEIGGSSDDDLTDERTYEVHENNPFNRSNSIAQPAAQNKAGSNVRFPLGRNQKNKTEVDGELNMPTSVSAPMPVNYSNLSSSQVRKIDPYGSLSRMNDGLESTRQRKRSTFLGLGAITGLFARRGRSSSLSSIPGEVGTFPARSFSTPKGGSQWQTRTDQNLKRARKTDDSSDDDIGGMNLASETAIDYEGLRKKSIVESKALPRLDTDVSRGKPNPNANSTPSKSGGAGKKKLRKAADSPRKRNASAVDVSAGANISGSPGQPNKTVKGEGKTSSPDGVTRPLKAVPPHMQGAVISRSSTRSSQTTATRETQRSASLEIPLSSANRRAQRGSWSDIGHNSSVVSRGNSRLVTSNSVVSPATRGQMNLMSIVEDVAKQNRDGWSQINPNNTLFEVKAPRSIVPSFLPGDDNAITTFVPSALPLSDQESPLVRKGGPEGKRRILTPATTQNVGLHRLSTISASSNSEPSLPLRDTTLSTSHSLSPTSRLPLRSALRNRTPSPILPDIPRSVSPVRFVEKKSVAAAETVSENATTQIAKISASSKEDDTSSIISSISAYETGREDFDDESTAEGPPTPPPHDLKMKLPQITQLMPNGIIHEHEAPLSTSSGTVTPPSRRKSVRMSLQPTFSPTPPALYDFEEDHSPWNGTGPTESKVDTTWRSRVEQTQLTWEDSSDEDEEYNRARQMLQKASKSLEKAAHVGRT